MVLIKLATANPPENCYGNRSREMATVDPEFVAYMRTQNLTAEQATDVAEKLSLAGLHSASDFLGFYSTKGTDMYRWTRRAGRHRAIY